MDQFTYAERATDWRANNNIAESIFQQMRHERFPSRLADFQRRHRRHLATLGRFVRYRRTRPACCAPTPSARCSSTPTAPATAA
jgi:cysteine synthase A